MVVSHFGNYWDYILRSYIRNGQTKKLGGRMKRIIFCLVILALLGLLSGNAYTEYFKCPENSLPDPVLFQYSSDRPMDADHVIPENGGTIGEDSFYNPTNGIIYVYGGMYLTLIDADDNSLITSLQVTNQLCKRHSSLTYPRDNNLFAYVEATNTLFCATEIGSIVVINCDTNSIESEMNDYAILNKIPSQHRLLYDNMSQTLFQYFNTDEYAGTGSARLIAYSVTSTYPYLEVKYSTPDLTGNDKIFDLILHYDTSLTGTRWLLFSTEAGDIKYINCFDDNFNNVHVAYSVTVDRQARGFCMSMDPMDPENPADDQPEILCGTYHSTECGYIRILKIVSRVETGFS